MCEVMRSKAHGIDSDEGDLRSTPTSPCQAPDGRWRRNVALLKPPSRVFTLSSAPAHP